MIVQKLPDLQEQRLAIEDIQGRADSRFQCRYPWQRAKAAATLSQGIGGEALAAAYGKD